jgi:c-di-GMP-binding flagellar brake protein YcgR
MLKERRISPRVKCEIGTEIYSNTDGKYIGRGVIENISTKGAGLLVDYSLLIHGEDVSLKFTLEKWGLICVSGEVIYVKNKDEKFYCGIKFKEVDFITKEYLRKYVVEKSKKVKYTL